jgi:hypothetical protein
MGDKANVCEVFPFDGIGDVCYVRVEIYFPNEQQFLRCPLCPDSGRSSLPAMPLRLMAMAHDVISSQQPVATWHGAPSGDLAQTFSIVARGGAVAPWHPRRCTSWYGLRSASSFLRAARTLPSTASAPGPAVHEW